MIAKSFSGLVKFNNGLFRSAAQAEYLLSKCKDNKFIDDTPKDAAVFYHCDEKGVAFVERYSMKTSKTKKEWEREESGKITVQAEREIKRLLRIMEDAFESIAARDVAFEKGQYAGIEELYTECIARDRKTIKEIEAMISNIMNVS